MVSISVIMNSARDDYPLIGLPNIHILQPTIQSLKIQTFKDFEFIFVDGLYHLRPRLFADDGLFNKKELPFNIEHLPVEHNPRFNHRFWLDNRRWNVCGGLNTAIIHAKGELITRIDDAAEFDSRYLQRIWNEYETGLWLNAMHIRYLEGRPAILDEKYRNIGYEMNYTGGWDINREYILKRLYGDGGLIRDSRYSLVVEKGGRMIGDYSWFYGYSSFTLKAALTVNGFDELFDGDKSVEDSDMGSRLELAGYREKYLLDVNHQVIEHEHGPLSNLIIDINGPNIKCNYAIYLLNRKKNKFRANDNILDTNDMEFIRKETLKPPCSPTPNFYDENCNGKWWDIWKKNQPIFDLREERKFYDL